MSFFKHILIASFMVVGFTGEPAMANLTVTFSTNPTVVLVPMPFRYGYYVVDRRYYRYKKGHRSYVSDYQIARYQENRRSSNQRFKGNHKQGKKHGNKHGN